MLKKLLQSKNMDYVREKLNVNFRTDKKVYKMLNWQNKNVLVV